MQLNHSFIWDFIFGQLDLSFHCLVVDAQNCFKMDETCKTIGLHKTLGFYNYYENNVFKKISNFTQSYLFFSNKGNNFCMQNIY